MIKVLIFISLVFFTFEIDHCEDVDAICKKCMDGYRLIWSYCSQQDLTSTIEHCIYGNSYNNRCNFCEKGYALTVDGKCKENTIHCKLFEGDSCVECEEYFKLEKGKCEKSSCYEYEDGVCQCEEGFYNNDKGGCSKIPIKFCEIGNRTHCKECDLGYYVDDKYECSKVTIEFCEHGNKDTCKECKSGYYLDKGKCLKIPFEFCESGDANSCDDCEGGYDWNETSKKCEKWEDYEEDNGGNIQNCIMVNKNDNTICDQCYSEYFWDSQSKTCKSVCTQTEEVCDECAENYYSYDYGKTCEKIDPEYIGDDENDSRFLKIELAVLAILSFLLI